MADRIGGIFSCARAEHRAALLPYLMLGYPDLETSLAAARAALQAGADGLELGVPFSDPLADGPTIQHAGDIALRGGMTLARGLEAAAELRAYRGEAALLLMSYFNPLLAYGLEALCRDASLAGVDGLIVPDLPPEEGGPLEAACAPYGLAIIYLLAPTSSSERIAQVAARSKGMLYLVSVTGVTGAREALPPELAAFVGRVRSCTTLPLAVGFGISTPEQARAVGQLADGVIVGSALLRRLEQEGVPGVSDFVRALRAALNSRDVR